jgi:general secretion pathway protein D
MSRRRVRLHQALALAIALALAVPVVALANDGRKHFKEGLKYEANRQWDKAAEQFAQAYAASPSNVEYQLHLQRALVQAALMLVERGDTLAEKKDYNAAYTAYRQAYAFDRGNELALIKMRRMLELQGLDTKDLPTSTDPSGPKLKPDKNSQKAAFIQGAAYNPTRVQVPGIPGRRFPKQDVVFRDTNLGMAIEQLAGLIKINVMFDQQIAGQMRTLRTNVDLKDVTYPKALEMLLKTHGFMYAQLDSRTIVVAADNPQSRQKYEPFAVRTFYIKNTEAQEMRTAVTATLTQVKQINPIKQLNALVVRDTPSNLELVEQLINSLDKSKAEVLIDVNIYEVSRADLTQIGNQFLAPGLGPQNALNVGNLGGLGQNAVVDAAARAHTFIGTLGSNIPLGFALGMPASAISFFQDRGKVKLLASTQVHVLDAENNTVNIGQRVPIQTASLPTFNTVPVRDQARANQQAGVAQQDFTAGVGGAFLGGIPQIQYENVGLNIEVTPNVYEDEVQMKMKISTTSVDSSTGILTPTFNQRTLSSIARVRDGQQTLIAGVSSLEEAKRVRTIPIIGLIPILGRFFATPEVKNRQSDVVITVTPHILRRADITEEDHLAYAAGDWQSSNNQLKIEQIVFLAEYEEQQQPSPRASGGADTTPPATRQPPPSTLATSPRPESHGVVVQPPPVAPASRANITRTQVSRPGAPEEKPAPNTPNPAANTQQQRQPIDDDDDDDDDDEADETPAAQGQGAPLMVYVRPASPVGVKGQDLYVAVFVNGPSEVSSAHVTLSFDPNILEVKGVRDSGLMSTGARAELQFQADSGTVNIQLDRPQGSPGVVARGQLCLVVFTTKGQGASPLTLAEQTSFRTPAGQPAVIRLQSSQVEVR